MSTTQSHNPDQFSIPVFEDLNAEPTKGEIISAICKLQSQKSYEGLNLLKEESLRELDYNELKTIYKETLSKSKKHIEETAALVAKLIKDYRNNQ